MAEEESLDLAIEIFRDAYRHQMKGELREAVELYHQSIETYPTAEAYTFLGWTYSFMGNYDAAIAECHRAIELGATFCPYCAADLKVPNASGFHAPSF